MALTITKLKMWKDPGYTRGCMEVPPAGSKKLPSPADYATAADETLRPHKDSTLTILHLPLSFTETFGMSYLYIEATDGKGSVNLFGWIDSITQRSTSAEGVTIMWTVDWWRSYSDQITFGTGNIRRCSDSSFKRPYPTQPRKWKVTSYEVLCNNRTDHTTFPYWVIVTHTVKVSDTVVNIETLFWQCNFDTAKTDSYGGDTIYAIPLNRIFSGEWIGLLGLNPDEVTSIYISPYPPDTASTAGAPYTHDAESKKWFAYRAYYNAGSPGSSTFSGTYESDDLKKAVVVDPNGSVVYTLPWGESIDHAYYIVDTGTVGCNLDILFYKGSVIPLGINNAPIGKTATIPCIAAPVCSNGWSSYNYSGQRAYDIEMKAIQREEQAVSGIISMGSSVVGGGIGGAMVGKGAGAGIGAVAGGLGSIVSTGLNYHFSQQFNDRYQEATDKLHANQASSILQSAGGIAFINTVANSSNWYIVQLEADDVSMAEYIADTDVNGYEVDINAGTSTYITTGGPLQIINLNLTGDAPPQAKQSIKDMFVNGVRIIENNPSGVVP